MSNLLKHWNIQKQKIAWNDDKHEWQVMLYLEPNSVNGEWLISKLCGDRDITNTLEIEGHGLYPETYDELYKLQNALFPKDKKIFMRDLTRVIKSADDEGTFFGWKVEHYRKVEININENNQELSLTESYSNPVLWARANRNIDVLYHDWEKELVGEFESIDVKLPEQVEAWFELTTIVKSSQNILTALNNTGINKTIENLGNALEVNVNKKSKKLGM